MTNEEKLLLVKARTIALRAHANQFRRDGKTPYIVHPDAVASRVSSINARALAYVHDIVEHDPASRELDIVKGLPDEVLEALDLLTHDPKDSYMEYLSKIKPNGLATRVKIADMISNLADDPTEHQIVKYSKGMLFLVGESV